MRVAADYVNTVCKVDISSIDNVSRDATLARLILRAYARNLSTLAKKKEIYKDVNANMNYVDDIRERYNLDCLGNICDESALESRCSDARFQNVMEALDKKLMALREKSAVVEQLRSIGEVANEVVERHTRRRNENDETFRMMSGFTELDGLMGGLHRGELTVLGGTTSSGKTSVAMSTEEKPQYSYNARPVGNDADRTDKYQTIQQLLIYLRDITDYLRRTA